MSGAITIAATAAAVGTAYSIYSGERASKKQDQAQQAAQTAAAKQEKLADQAVNAANRKTPDVSAMLSSAAQMGKSGPASTLLTGAGGVDPNALLLGKNTLLGG